MSYSFQPLSPAQLGNLQYLYKAVFRKNVSLDFLAKKYNTTSFGAEWVGYLAIDLAGKPAAFYGVLPCYVVIDGKTVLAAQSADTMTHPDHQRQGLFQQLAIKTYALAKEKSIEFIFGFPNQNSLRGFEKLGWTFQLEPMQFFMVPVKTVPYAKAIAQISLLTKIAQRLGEVSFEKPTPKLFDNKNQNEVCHDEMFLRYKTYHTSHVVTWGTTRVWFKIDGSLKIGMISGLESETGAWLLQKLKRLATTLGCSRIIFMTQKSSELFNLLSPLLPSSDGLPIGFHNLSEQAYDFNTLHFEYADIDIF